MTDWNDLKWGIEIGCLHCVHFKWDKWGTCDAFTNLIPFVIGAGQVDHRESYTGDKGITFAPRVADFTNEEE